MPTVPPTDAFHVTVDGIVYAIDPTDFDRFEWRALKDRLGLTQVEVLTAMAQLDLDAIAGLVWLQRRREEPDLDLDDVNIKLSSLFEPDEEADASPPA